MSFPQQDYLAMLKAKPPVYSPVQQAQQTPIIYPNPQFMPQLLNYPSHYMMMQQLQQMQQMQQMQQIPQMPLMRISMIPQAPQLQTLPQPVMPYQTQQQNPAQQKIDHEVPVSVKGTKVKLNLKMIKDLPLEEDSILDYDEIKRQSGDYQYINLKRKRRLLDQLEAPLMQTRRRSEQSQYLEIREMLKVDDRDMTIILETYPDTKSLLQELRKGNLKKEIAKLLLK